MQPVLRHIFRFLLHLGPFGPLILGVLDSSFLFAPFGNDLLLIVSIARRHQVFPVYVLMATIGSTLGVFLLDMVTRRAGERGLRKLANEKRFIYLKKKMSEHAAWAVVIACITPPPFPFTVVIAAASAFQYPRARLLGLVFAARLVRYSLLGWAAIRFGRQIVLISQSEQFKWFMVGFVALCVAGSVISVIRWTRR